MCDNLYLLFNSRELDGSAPRTLVLYFYRSCRAVGHTAHNAVFRVFKVIGSVLEKALIMWIYITWISYIQWRELSALLS